MSRYFLSRALLKNTSGTAQIDTTTTFAIYTNSGRTTLATCYSADTGTTTVTNPLVADANGVVSCYLTPNQRYYWTAGSYQGEINAVQSTTADLSGEFTAPIRDFGGQVVDLAAWGVIPDLRQGITASMTSGSAAITTTDGFFTSTAADGGKYVQVNGAGASGAALVGTISSVTDSNHATLSVSAGTTVSNARYTFGTDNTTAVQTAITYANSLVPLAAGNQSVYTGGIKVLWPNGGIIHGYQIPLYSLVSHQGQGYRTTVLFLKGGTNKSMFLTKDFATLTLTNPGAGVYSGPHSFVVRDMTIDANQYAQTSGVLLSIVLQDAGSGYSSNPTITFSGGGAVTQATATATQSGGAVNSMTITGVGSGYTSIPTITFSGGGTPTRQATARAVLDASGLAMYGYSYILENVIIQNAFGVGLYSEWSNNSGAIDPDEMECHWTTVKVHDCLQDGIIFCGPHDAVNRDVISYNNSQGGTRYQLWLAGNGQSAWYAFHGYEGGPATPVIYNQCSQCRFTDCVAEGDSGGPQVVFTQNTNSWLGGTVYAATGTPSANTVGFQLGISTSGSGFNYIEGTIVNDCVSGAVDFTNSNGNNYVRVMIYTPETSPTPAAYKGSLNINDDVQMIVTGIAPSASATQVSFYRPQPYALAYPAFWSAQVIAASGTINWTNGNGAFTYIPISAASAVTGVIMQAGVIDGQLIYLVNTGSFSITFNTTPATSHIAAATYSVPATTTKLLIWNAGIARWVGI